ncbi:MAG: efflux RND transporter periplasmic adaptor subunit [Syntrophomonadaceae bacterium]|nr:efflux RND transporter periplasmic adaptor subunit [Syntrophomonadaceae bacterium]
MSDTNEKSTPDEHILINEEDLEPMPGHAPLDVDHVRRVIGAKRIQGMSTPKKIAWALVLVLALAASAYGVYKWRSGSAEVTYSTATVGKGTVTYAIEATGTLEAVRESDLGFKSDDAIIAINVQPGDHVTAGQLLAEQDPATYKTALQQAQNTVHKDQISLKTANLSYQTNLKNFNQQKQLFDAGAISQSELDDAQDALTRSEWEVEVANVNLANDRIKLAQAERDLAGAAILAPFDGIVGAVNGQVGQLSGINTSSSTLLTVMSDELQLSTLVNEADIGKIQVGQAAEFTSSSFANITFRGKVERITPQAQTVSSVQYYPVLISVEDPEGVLLSGMSVSANIIMARQENVLTVPMMAVSYATTYLRNNPSLAPSSGGKAVVVMENGQPVVKAVTLGINDGSNYVVTGGLNEGEAVIVGANQASTSGTTTSTTNRNSTNRNQGGGVGGPPMGGF